MIEDCAHVLTGTVHGRPLGSFGDIAVFSWRKFLPLYDGGQLVVNNQRLQPALPFVSPSLLLRLRVWKNVVDRVVADSPCWRGDVVRGFLTSLSRAGRRLFDRGRTRAPALTINNYGLDFDPASLNLPMSGPSRLILGNTDTIAIARVRQKNYRTLQQAISSLRGLIPFFPDLPEGVCPWVFPVVAPGRLDFHVELRARGIPAATWSDVVHRDLPLEHFPDAAFLYENLIFLPVHQSLTATELDLMVRIIAEALSCHS